LRSLDFFDSDISTEFPPALVERFDDELPCGVVPGSIILQESIFTIQEGQHYQSIEGTFIPAASSSAAGQTVMAKVFGLDGLQGTSAVSEEGTFSFIVTEIGPGTNPYFIVMTCETPPTVRRLQEVNETSAVQPFVINNDAEICMIETNPGFLSATLTWGEGTSDIDLHTYGPDGEHVFFVSPSGTIGSLDVDDMYGYGPENFYSPSPQNGTYSFEVVSYYQDDGLVVPWDLVIYHGQTLVRHEQGLFYNSSEIAGPFDVQIGEPGRRLVNDIPTTYSCPPVSTVKWYCNVLPCPESTKYDTSSLEAYNTVMSLYDDTSVSEGPAKAIILFFGNQYGDVGRMDELELKSYLSRANQREACIREAFEDAVCYTLEYSDFFSPKRLTLLQKVSALNAFRQFLLGVATGSPAAVATNVVKLMTDVVVPEMNEAIGDISFLFRGDPCSKLQRRLLTCG
jgi:hypothetical protein